MHGEAFAAAAESPAFDAERPKVIKKRKILRPTLGAEAPNGLIEVDDADEISKRNLHRIMEEATKFTHSPNVSPERRKSLTANSGMSNAQIAEHITNCLKLNAENKITPKNAFNLHLIDMMGSLLDKETNFQTAGSTLDASAKIYSYRVDSVHQETYKIAGGLGRTDKNAKQQNSEGGNLEGNNVEEFPNEKLSSPIVKKRKKKLIKGSCIETNEKSINITGHEVKFENDELFENVRSSFDEGSALGLFSNTLQTVNDSNRLVLHSLCELPVIEKLSSSVIDVADLFIGLSLEGTLGCCPPLKEFEFLNWNQDDEERLESRSICRPEFAAKLDLSQVEAGSSTMGTKVDVDNSPPPNFGLEAESADDDGNDAASESSYDAVNDIVPKFPSLELVANALSTKELEYSYFDPNLLSTYNGPNHWKAKFVKKEPVSDTDSDKSGPKTKRPRKATKKDRDERVDLDDDDLPLAQIFRLTKAATTLAKSTLEKYAEDQHLLDPDMEYRPDNFNHLFLKPDFTIKTKPSGSIVCDNNSVGYDVDNPVDKNNFCADTSVNDGFQDDDNFDDAVEDVSYGDVPDYGKIVDGNVVNGDGPSTCDDPTEHGAVLDDENVLKQPYKVNKIDINYAKQAKRVDVRRVKQSIWQVLTRNEKMKSPDVPDKLTTETALSTLCMELPKVVSSQTADNLSVHTTLTILLHMCNEKNLSLENTEEFNDIKISQG